MEVTRYLLIGAGLAAHNAAKAIRESDKSGSITMVGAEPHRPYNRPPLTKEYMQGKDPLEKAFCESGDFYRQQRISTMFGTSVVGLDAGGKVAMLSDGESIAFEKCLLAMGGRPVMLSLPGVELPDVSYFRTMDDAVKVSQLAESRKRLAIIGGGFIGMEIAASLTQRGVKVSVINSGPYIWNRFVNRELAEYVQAYCQHKGVEFYSGQKAKAIEGDAAPRAVVLEDGQRVPCDFVVAAAGIVPNVELAQRAGLKVDNGVIVDEHMMTSRRDIYAVGDLCNFMDPYFGRRRRVEHWGLADYTGTLAGQNMAGAAEKFDLLSYVWSDLFDLHIEFAGDESQSDRTILRGRMETNSFSLLYLKDDVLTAHFSVNLKKKQYQPLQKLIEKKVKLSGKDTQLADMNFDVATLLPQEQPATR